VSPGNRRLGSVGSGSRERLTAMIDNQYPATSWSDGLRPSWAPTTASAITQRLSPGRTIHAWRVWRDGLRRTNRRARVGLTAQGPRLRQAAPAGPGWPSTGLVERDGWRLKGPGIAGGWVPGARCPGIRPGDSWAPGADSTGAGPGDGWGPGAAKTELVGQAATNHHPATNRRAHPTRWRIRGTDAGRRPTDRSPMPQAVPTARPRQ
jgi:hypothetical protein